MDTIKETISSCKELQNMIKDVSIAYNNEIESLEKAIREKKKLLKESTKDLETANNQLIIELNEYAQDILNEINDISEYCTINDVDSLGIHYSNNYHYAEPDNNYLLKHIFINWVEDISDNNIYFESYAFDNYGEREYFILCIPIKLFDKDYFNDTKHFSEIINKSRINRLENKIKEMQDEIDDLRSER